MTNKYVNPKQKKGRASWRDFQASLKVSSSGRNMFKPIVLAGLVTAACLLIFTAFTFMGNSEDKENGAGQAQAKGNSQPLLIEKKDVRILLGKNPLFNISEKQFRTSFDGREFTVSTTLDTKLQDLLIKKMDRKNSRYIGIVAMDPETGRIVALAGFDKTRKKSNTCTTADFPAASIFKIVTAAAAIEQLGYTSASRMKFNGYKHTLYKKQLTNRTNKYTNNVSLKHAFAQSINPVFGKIGALGLKKDHLESFGSSFLFNTTIGFETDCGKSILKVEEIPYHWAEVASGFNRQTTISPLHGAVMASVATNKGKPVEPTVIEKIESLDGSPVYISKPTFLAPAVSENTAGELKKMMAATISSGTARKAFRGHKRDKTLSKLIIGGKTGSIFNRSHDARFDWFVGFAEEKKGDGKLVVSTMVAHEEYIGKRAAYYARMAISSYFKTYFAKMQNT